MSAQNLKISASPQNNGESQICACNIRTHSHALFVHEAIVIGNKRVNGVSHKQEELEPVVSGMIDYS